MSTRFGSKGFASFFLIILLSGCATAVKGTTQKVPVTSDPTNADVLVDGNLAGQTPLTVSLKRKNDHLLTIQKTGFQPKSVPVVKEVGGAVWGNILAGGLIGWGVDAVSGSQYNLIPATISVKLESGTAQANAAENSSSTFIDKLKTLDQLHEEKKISDEEYGRSRVELLRKFMPEALPPEARSDK